MPCAPSNTSFGYKYIITLSPKAAIILDEGAQMQLFIHHYHFFFFQKNWVWLLIFLNAMVFFIVLHCYTEFGQPITEILKIHGCVTITTSLARRALSPLDQDIKLTAFSSSITLLNMIYNRTYVYGLSLIVIQFCSDKLGFESFFLFLY